MMPTHAERGSSWKKNLWQMFRQMDQNEEYLKDLTFFLEVYNSARTPRVLRFNP